jgi:hypothetical protein
MPRSRAEPTDNKTRYAMRFGLINMPVHYFLVLRTICSLNWITSGSFDFVFTGIHLSPSTIPRWCSIPNVINRQNFMRNFRVMPFALVVDELKKRICRLGKPSQAQENNHCHDEHSDGFDWFHAESSGNMSMVCVGGKTYAARDW